MSDPSTPPHWLQRTELLVGATTLEKLRNLHVLVIGLGGVGSLPPSFWRVPASAK